MKRFLSTILALGISTALGVTLLTAQDRPDPTKKETKKKKGGKKKKGPDENKTPQK